MILHASDRPTKVHDSMCDDFIHPSILGTLSLITLQTCLHACALFHMFIDRYTPGL